MEKEVGLMIALTWKKVSMRPNEAREMIEKSILVAAGRSVSRSDCDKTYRGCVEREDGRS